MDGDVVYLITKADDLGSNDSANRAFIRAYQEGVLRNGAIMMPCAGARKAAEFFRNRTDFCVGLHLTVNAEWDNVRWGPVLPPESVPSLVDKNGTFFKTTKELKDNNPKLEELMAEVHAQYDMALSMGLEIHFLDYHMWFCHAVSGAEEAIGEFAIKKGLVNLRRFPAVPRIETTKNEDRAEAVISALGELQPGLYYYFMGHPALNTQEMRMIRQGGTIAAGLAEERAADLLTMIDKRVQRYMEQKGILPVTIRQAMQFMELEEKTNG